MSWLYLQTGTAGQDALPAFQAGHAGSIPVARSSLLTFIDLVFPLISIQAFLSGGEPIHAIFLQLNCNPRT
jgi:hypothetical protein